jgi:hypothetical protein
MKIIELIKKANIGLSTVLVIVFLTTSTLSLIAFAAFTLPTENLPTAPSLQPSVITAKGYRYLLDHYAISDTVTATYNQTTNQIDVTPKGWYLINFPFERISGFTNKTPDQISKAVTGKSRSQLKNWYFHSPLQGAIPNEPDYKYTTGTKNINPNPNIVVNNMNPASSDSNPGTLALPKRTIQAGYNSLTPGQTLQVVAGKYIENLNFGTNGTQASPIVIEGKLDSNNNLPNIETTIGDGVKVTGAYNTVRNFKFTDQNGNYQDSIVKLDATPQASGQVIEFSRFEGANGRGVSNFSTVGRDGVYSYTRGNVFVDSGTEALGIVGNDNSLTNDNVNQAPGYAKVIVEYNYIYNSNVNLTDPGNEGGISKTVWSTQSIIRYNYADKTYGFGWWYDWMNYNNVLEGNYVKDADGAGIALGEASPGPQLAINNVIVGTSVSAPFKSGITGWDSTRHYAYGNTIDGKGVANARAIQTQTGNGHRGTKFQNEAPAEPYDIGQQEKLANNVGIDHGEGTIPYKVNAIVDVANFGNDNLGVTQLSLANSFVKNYPEDYRLTVGSNLSNVGNRTEGLRYSNKDYFGLLRNIAGDDYSAGAYRPTNSGCPNNGSIIEFENLDQSGVRLCALANNTPTPFASSSSSATSSSTQPSSVLSSSVSSSVISSSSIPSSSTVSSSTVSSSSQLLSSSIQSSISSSQSSSQSSSLISSSSISSSSVSSSLVSSSLAQLSSISSSLISSNTLSPSSSSSARSSSSVSSSSSSSNSSSQSSLSSSLASSSSTVSSSSVISSSRSSLSSNNTQTAGVANQQSSATTSQSSATATTATNAVGSPIVTTNLGNIATLTQEEFNNSSQNYNNLRGFYGRVLSFFGNNNQNTNINFNSNSGSGSNKNPSLSSNSNNAQNQNSNTNNNKVLGDSSQDQISGLPSANQNSNTNSPLSSNTNSTANTVNSNNSKSGGLGMIRDKDGNLVRTGGQQIPITIISLLAILGMYILYRSRRRFGYTKKLN